ncbi:AraC family transcriptional regulator [Sagittula sp. NFXS13]|uniref:AraC family transcriptional regulator n=1 Tax=Sagittula sp. NFXS13 TaxID=2819095 RepID=UPI0032DE5450
MTPDCRREVTLVVYRGFKTLEATGPLSVLGYASQHLQAAGHKGGYDVTIAAPRTGLTPSDTVMSLEAEVVLRDLGACDTHRRGARRRAGGGALVSPIRARNNPLCRALHRIVFLAEAGLLDGQRAATHWNYAARMRLRFPDVTVDADAIFVQAGSFWTSAGVTAAIDLALAFVEQDYGRDSALALARDMVMYLKCPGEQSQLSTLLTGQSAGATAWAMC